MGLLGTLIAGLSAAFFVMIIVTQVMLRRRARAMTGATLPALPGAVGRRVAASKKHALVYFFSPTCGACRTITPRVRELEKNNSTVFTVDVTTESDLARALGVMATPSTIEVSNGHIAGYHVGQIPPAVLARFVRA